MGNITMKGSLVALVAIVAAWHLVAEALPVQDVDEIALLEKSTSAQKAASKQADKSKAQGAAALAKVHKTGTKADVKGVSSPAVTAATLSSRPTSTASAPASTPLPNAASANSDSTTVRAPSLPPTSAITQATKPLVAPSEKKHLNRDIPVGKKGHTDQQAEKAILSGNHQIHQIDKKLVKERAARYSEARGAVELQQASAAAAKATADMAAEIRKEAARKAAKAIQRVTLLSAKISKAKGKKKARLQIELAKAKSKKNSLMQKAVLAGKAVNRAINKAAEVEGRAEAQAVSDQDETTRLEHAVVAAASAKMKLAAFDKETAVANNQQSRDKKEKKHWKEKQAQAHAKIAVAKAKFDAASAAARKSANAAAFAAAKAFAKKAHLKGTVLSTERPTKAKVYIQQCGCCTSCCKSGSDDSTCYWKGIR